MSTAIEFNNVSKQYKLGLVSTKTLSHDLNRWWQTKILGKEDPYLKIGSVNDRSAKADSDYVWALKDIDFKVEQGDVVGIIGKNGAGKSTLLKLLSRVTNPTTGTIRARGRIASLLEVGTGFHPELTGRENIYMNGSIMGMNKAEITRKLDEIVAFSGCERYIDTPVKRYSSGMTVRLGFAIAAHLDPEILVVDEVLAVGDAEFQKKAIGKMQDVSKGEGRTVLFVSHNMASIKSLCRRGVVLDKGMIVCDDVIQNAISYYKNNGFYANGNKKILDYAIYHTSSIKLSKVTINGVEKSTIKLESGENDFTICINGVNFISRYISLEIRVTDENDIPLALFVPDLGKDLKYYDEGEFEIKKNLSFPKNVVEGNYFLSISLVHPFVQGYVDIERCVNVEYGGDKTYNGFGYNYNQGLGWLQIY